MSDLVVKLHQAELGRRRVLNDVSLTCKAGTHLAVLGPNGAGKTTLLRCIAGLLPYDGDIRVAGRSLSELDSMERAREVSYVPQRSLLEAELSVEQVVMMGRYCHQDVLGRERQADRDAVDRALRLMDVMNLRHRGFPRLSGGEQRRVLLARALATEARVVLLDEPTDALDLAHALSLFEHLKQFLRADKVVISVMHHIADADRHCNRICLLREGRVHYLGPSPLPQAMVREVYGVDVVENAAPLYTLPNALRSQVNGGDGA